jgi:hypothetical protein
MKGDPPKSVPQKLVLVGLDAASLKRLLLGGHSLLQLANARVTGCNSSARLYH